MSLGQDAPAAVASSRLPFPVLESLLAPLDAASFFASTWEKKPLLLRGVSPRRAAFQAQSWCELATAAFSLGKNEVEILRPGKAEAVADLATAERAFSGGASIRILQAQRYWDVAKEFCRELALELSHDIGANVFVTPGGQRGLDTHVDDHDVFVVQMHGRTHWRLFGEPYRLPLGHRPLLIFERRGASRADNGEAPHGARQVSDAELGPPQLEAVLEPGDLLYVPRGLVHRATALDDGSVHVTLGVHAATWADLLAAVVARAAREDLELRLSLPPGFARLAEADSGFASRARELLHAAARSQDPRDAFEEVAARFFLAARQKASGVRVARVAAEEPSDEEPLRLAPDVLIALRDDAVALRRCQPGEEDVFLPAAFESALLEMAAQPSFRIRELRVLTPASERSLVLHLARKRVVVRAC